MSTNEIEFDRDLFCYENVSMELESMTCNSYLDPILLKDDRVLEKLLENEERYMPNPSYLSHVQTDVNPGTRQTLAHWMYEVCAKNQEEVFTLAMNLLDRFLSVVKMRKNQLQVLAAACMLLASKLKENCPLDVPKLVYYGDDSFTLEELKKWELVVLTRLKWDLSSITPHAFLDQILDRLELDLSETHREHVRDQATHNIRVCATESIFTPYPPSLVAAAAVASAVQGILPQKNKYPSNTNNMLLSSYSRNSREQNNETTFESEQQCSSCCDERNKYSNNYIRTISGGYVIHQNGVMSDLLDTNPTCCVYPDSNKRFKLNNEDDDDNKEEMTNVDDVRGRGSKREDENRRLTSVGCHYMKDLYKRLRVITHRDTECLLECQRQIDNWSPTSDQVTTTTTTMTTTSCLSAPGVENVIV